MNKTILLNPEEIKSHYKKGESLKSIGKIYSCSRTPIKRALKSVRVVLREPGMRTGIVRPHRYSVDEDFFETIDTQAKAYWLGFIAADGCISITTSKKLKRTPRKTISFSLALKDLKTLETFKTQIESTYPIVFKSKMMNGKIFHRGVIKFYSSSLFDSLVDKGITPRKSLTLKPPKHVPESLIHHWIRGYFDGDGCITGSKNRDHVSILGTRKVLGFIKFSSKVGNTIRPKSGSQTFILTITGKKSIQEFCSYIYQGAHVKLERKSVRFKIGGFNH